jgi:DNA-binding NarL/FixJ family response regulator
MTRRIRVLLVEDNAAYRETLAFLLGRRREVEVVGEVATGAEAAEASARLQVDVAVVDVRLPDLGGAETAAAVRERTPGTSVVFLSASTGEDERRVAEASGVSLVRKDDGVEALVEAIEASVRGRS